MKNPFLSKKELDVVRFWRTKQNDVIRTSFNIELYLKIKYLRIEESNRIKG